MDIDLRNNSLIKGVVINKNIMAKKIRRTGCCGSGVRGKSMVRTASKSMEKQIVASSQRLYDNPLLVLPTYSDRFSEKRFKKIAAQLSKINQIKDDTKKLEKLSNKRSLVSAVAGTLLVAHSKKAPYLASAQYASDSIIYAQRGKATREDLIAAQHTDDPFFRLFGVRDMAMKYGLHLYSWDSGFISTGLEAKPPKEFIDFILKTFDYKIQKNIVSCQHISPSIIHEKKINDTPYLLVNWKSADITFGICKHCASKKKNLIFSITKYLIEPDVRADFDVEVIGEIIKEGKTDLEYETSHLDEYFKGSLTDYKLITLNMEKRVETLQSSNTVHYVLDGTSYGNDSDKFIDSLEPNTYEKQALQFMLQRSNRSVVVTNTTPNSVLELFWDDQGKDFLHSLLDDEEVIEELFALHEIPSTIIKTAFQLTKRREILQQLPQYKDLPEVARFADRLTRIYKTEGAAKMIAAIKQRPDTPQGKAMAYAFLQAVGKAEDKKWKFSKVEIESGDFLTPFAKKLLDGTPDSYHKVFQELLKASGSSAVLDEHQVT